MIGLELAVAGWLHLASNEVKCIHQTAPKITVLPSKSTVTYDFSKSQAQLDGFDVDTVSPYGPGLETHIGGLMSGEVMVQHRVEFMQERYQHVDAGCLYIDKIDVNIHINPTIYVASDYPRGSCKHNAIIEHEKKHIQIDRVIVNKYAERIGRALEKILNNSGSSYGPYRMSDLPAAQKQVQSSIDTAVRRENDLMNEERKAKQQQIDTVDEYNRVEAVCSSR